MSRFFSIFTKFALAVLLALSFATLAHADGASLPGGSPPPDPPPVDPPPDPDPVPPPPSQGPEGEPDYPVILPVESVDGPELKTRLIEGSLPGLTTDDPISTCSYLTAMFGALIGFSAVIAILILVIAGIQYIGGAASVSATEDAKDRIKHALIGLLIALASFMLLYSIDEQLLGTCIGINRTDSASIEAQLGSLPPTPGFYFGVQNVATEEFEWILAGATSDTCLPQGTAYAENPDYLLVTSCKEQKVQDVAAPFLSLPFEILDIDEGEPFLYADAMEGVTAWDVVDGENIDLTDKVLLVTSLPTYLEPGVYDLCYHVIDAAENSTKDCSLLNVIPDNHPPYFVFDSPSVAINAVSNVRPDNTPNNDIGINIDCDPEYDTVGDIIPPPVIHEIEDQQQLDVLVSGRPTTWEVFSQGPDRYTVSFGASPMVLTPVTDKVMVTVTKKPGDVRFWDRSNRPKGQNRGCRVIRPTGAGASIPVVAMERDNPRWGSEEDICYIEPQMRYYVNAVPIKRSSGPFDPSNYLCPKSAPACGFVMFLGGLNSPRGESKLNKARPTCDGTSGSPRQGSGSDPDTGPDPVGGDLECEPDYDTVGTILPGDIIKPDEQQMFDPWVSGRAVTWEIFTGDAGFSNKVSFGASPMVLTPVVKNGLVTITKKPGDVRMWDPREPRPENSGCRNAAAASGGANVAFSVMNRSDSRWGSDVGTCYLEPNTRYYVNAIPFKKIFGPYDQSNYLCPDNALKCGGVVHLGGLYSSGSKVGKTIPSCN